MTDLLLPMTPYQNSGEKIMSIFTKVRQAFQSLLEATQRLIRYMSEAVTRIFSPTDDQYPETGVQPFEGDLSAQNNRRHQTW